MSHLMNAHLTLSLKGTYGEIIRERLVVVLTTYRDQLGCRFGFRYLINRVQQLADSRGCQTSLKVEL